MRILLALAAAVFPAAVFAAGTTALGPCPPGFVEVAPQNPNGRVTLLEGNSGTNVACMPAPPLRTIEPLIQPSPFPTPAPEPMPVAASVLRLVSLNPRSPTALAQETSTRVILRTYDDFDRVKTELVPLEDGGSATIRYTYWRNGVRKTMQDAFGRVTFYEYDGKNRLSRVTANQGMTDEHVTTYTYYPDDLLKTIAAPNGVLTSYGYDLADRVTSIAITRESVPLLSFAYTYDANGNRLSQTETNGGAPELTTYTYDQRDRLVTVTYPSGTSVEYVYDEVSNRTGEIERDPSGTIVSNKVAVFDAINRLTSVTDSVAPANDATFTYDANGNLRTKTTAAGTETYDYDPRDLMVEARKGTEIVARYAYDAFGRRYLKVSSEGAFVSVVRQYLYDQTSLLHELDDSDLEVAKYEYGGDRLASLVRRDEPRRFYHQDALGSVVALSDSGGAVVARYHLDAWGRYRAPSELDASANRFGFTGYLFDQETELYYAKARFYDPEYGRFTSQDSVLGEINEPPSLHRYFYGYANPLRFIDPTGHQSVLAEQARQGRTVTCDTAGCYLVDSSATSSRPRAANGNDTDLSEIANGLGADLRRRFAAAQRKAGLAELTANEAGQIGPTGDSGLDAQIEALTRDKGAARQALREFGEKGVLASDVAVGLTPLGVLEDISTAAGIDPLTGARVDRFTQGVGVVAVVLPIGAKQLKAAGRLADDAATSARTAERDARASTTAYHATTSSRGAEGVLGGIDPNFLNPESRFGRAFYVAEQSGTAAAELGHHGVTPTHGLRFSVDYTKAKVLDLTDPAVARQWRYSGGEISSETRALGSAALQQGYNVVRYPSLRGPGANLAVLADYNDLLKAEMVTPVR